jgi:hypothetical protein
LTYCVNDGWRSVEAVDGASGGVGHRRSRRPWVVRDCGHARTERGEDGEIGGAVRGAIEIVGEPTGSFRGPARGTKVPV